jgi:short-subunit dehydrogenase
MQVSSISELKRAIESNPRSIEILDADLARQAKILKTASGPAIAVLVAAAGVTATMWWNPIGWTSGLAMGAVGLTAESALVAAVAFFIASLGVGVLWALFNEWEIDASIEGSAPKGTAKAALKLRPSARK